MRCDRPIVAAALGGALWFVTGSSAAQDPPPSPPAASVGTRVEAEDAPANTAGAGAASDAIAAPDSSPPSDQAELTAEELSALGLSASEDGSALDKSLRFWGFADFTFSTLLMRRTSTWAGIIGRDPTFYVGNFNVYVAKNITERIRTLGEVRFTYLPNGTPDATTGAYASTQINSEYSTRSPQRWGGIIIQRIYAEATLHEYATLRMGHFLTPYGVWNVDHGSPVFVPVLRPVVLNQKLFPESQTGIELFARKRVATAHVLGYHLTLSNGLGPISEYRDLDRNKAVGGRLYWQYDALGQLQFGGSVFYGRDTSSVDTPGIDAQRTIRYTEKISIQSDVLALAADVRWTLGGYLLQGEFVSQQRRYTDDGRVGSVNPLLGQWIAPQDSHQFGAYLLTGYRFEWLGIMPYVYWQTIRMRDFRSSSEVRSNGLQGGLNIRPVEEFVIKVEYVWSKFNKNLLSTEPVHQLQAQVAWAF